MHEAFGDHVYCLSFNGRIDKGADGQERLSRIRIGVDGHLLVLLILFAFGIEFHFNLTFFARSDGLFWTFWYRTAARSFALIQEQWFGSCVGEFKHVRHGFAGFQRPEIMLIRGKSNGGSWASRCSSLLLCRIKIAGLTWAGIHRNVARV